MERHAILPRDSPLTTHPPGSGVAASELKRDDSFDLLDELELLLHRKGRLPVFLVTFIALALCFLVVGLLMATGIMLVTFLLFIYYSETPGDLLVDGFSVP